MHPACPNQKQNHLQNSLLRRTQFWVRKTFSKPASLKRASLVVGSSITLTQGIWMFSALDWAGENWIKTGKCCWHAEKKLTYTDPHWASRMTGRKEPAPLQAQHTPKNTSCCILPCSQSAFTPGAMSLECLMPPSCKLKSSFAQRRC